MRYRFTFFDRSPSAQEVTEKSIKQFRAAIRKLPADPPQDNRQAWYRTEKEHWLGWLRAYGGPGAYGRKGRNYDARYAYNHIVHYPMLLWLIKAAGVRADLVAAAHAAAEQESTKMARAGAVRRCVPWAIVAAALWGSPDAS
jgi:hypothetical protein